jgi:hypothetical protein
MNKTKFSLLIKKLQEYHIEITSINEKDQVVYSSQFVIFIEGDGSLDVSFHVSVRPDEAGILCLILKEINSLASSNKIKVGENYLPIGNGICLFGEEAEEYFKETMKKRIINNYIVERNQMESLLDDSKCFNV